MVSASLLVDFCDQINNFLQAFGLLLSRALQQADLLQDQVLNFALHERLLSLYDLFGFSRLFFDHSRILPLQLLDQLLNPTFLSPMKSLVSHQTMNALAPIRNRLLDHGFPHGVLANLISIILCTQFALVEGVAGEIDHKFVLGVLVLCDSGLDSPSQIMALEHDILQVISRYSKERT